MNNLPSALPLDEPAPLSLEEEILDISKLVFTVRLFPDSPFATMPGFLLKDKVVKVDDKNFFEVVAWKDTIKGRELEVKTV